MKVKTVVSCVVLAFVFAVMDNLYAESKISGYVFGDYYYVVDNTDTDIRNRNGFWIRRAYLTFDHDLSDGLTSRLRLEAASPGSFAAATTNVEPFIKDAYLKWKKGTHNVLLGLSPTPSWSQVEKFWGYRAVEKTPLDLHKFGSSRDFGLAAKGSFDSSKKLGYHMMVGNGNGTKLADNERNKKAYLSLFAKPVKWLFIEIYGDYENDNGGTPDTDIYTFQGFVGVKGKMGRIGLQGVHQTRERAGAAQFQRLEIVSAFGVLKITDHLAAYARADSLLDKNSKAGSISYIPMATNAEPTFTLIGVDIEVAKNFHIMPNVETVFYADQRQEDVIPRITFFYKFK